MIDPRPDCATVRESVSAELDGEPAALSADQVQGHLATCATCTRFAAALPAVNRQVTVAGAEAVPDLTAPVLVALAQDRAVGGERRLRDLRVLVALAGLVQLAFAFPALLGLTAAHLGRDLGAFELALGAGLLLAAWQPSRAVGVLPIAAIVAVVATFGAVVDVSAGRASVLSELPHLTELVGVAALWALTRQLPGVTVLRPAAAGSGGPIRGA